MNESLELSRWREAPLPLHHRRWAIVSTGMRQLLRTKFFQLVIALAWSGGLLIAAGGFAFSQSVAEGGWLAFVAHRFGPRAEAVVTALSGFVALFPDVVVNGIFTLIFWAHSYLGLWLSLLALTVLAPQLITRDRASNALIVYLARPLTSFDYLLGKLGIITSVLLVVWTGPLLAGWVLSMLFATDRDFLFYSLQPLERALLFNGIGLVSLSAIALGVSAASRSPRNTIVLWIGLWAIFSVVAAPPHAPLWLKRMSFTHDLGEIRQHVLHLDTALSDAASKLPMLDPRLVANLNAASEHAQPTDYSGALAALAGFTLAAGAIFLRRLRPE